MNGPAASDPIKVVRRFKGGRAPTLRHCMGLFSIFLVWGERLRQINPSGKISLFQKPKSPLRLMHPVPRQGALAIVTERWDGMRWTRRHRARNGIAGRDKLRERSQDELTSGVEAYGKSVWTRRLCGWRQVLRRYESPTGPTRRIP